MASEKKYTFARTYVGRLGVFIAGKSYRLTAEQAEAFKDIIEEAK